MIGKTRRSELYKWTMVLTLTLLAAASGPLFAGGIVSGGGGGGGTSGSAGLPSGCADNTIARADGTAGATQCSSFVVADGATTITSAQMPDPYVPVDGTMNVTGNLEPTVDLRVQGGFGVTLTNSGVRQVQFNDGSAPMVITPEATQGLRLNTSGAKVACSAAVRGSIFYEAGGADVADLWWRCEKDALNIYAWRPWGN